MGAYIVSVSVIRCEKLQFIYNFNRFVASMPLSRTIKTSEAVHR